MPTLLSPRQASSNSTTINPPPASNATLHHVPIGGLVAAIVIPLLFLAAILMIIVVLARRRKRRNASATGQVAPERDNQGSESTGMTQRSDGWLHTLHQAFNHPQSSSRPSAAGTQSTTTTGGTTEGRRGRRPRRDRLRRTDSGGTVKTLPEYNELGEDEILLYKAIDTPLESGESLAMVEVAVVAHGSNSRRSSRRSNRASIRSPSLSVAIQTDDGEVVSANPVDVTRGGSARRQSSLSSIAAGGLSALRRIPLRRNGSHQGGDEGEAEAEAAEGHGEEGEESTEMDTMLQAVNARETIPEEDSPGYDNLYPTITPHLQVHDEEGRLESNTRRGNALRNIFRRHPAPTSRQRAGSTSSLAVAELGLTPTRSNDVSLYRPSTSSSRNMLGAFLNNGSSASLLSQSGIDGGDTASRSSLSSARHMRNISAPISTRRLAITPPVAGFSGKQMQFLASVESLHKYGIPIGEGDQSSGGEGSVLPPSFEALARAQEAEMAASQAPIRLAPVLTTAEVQARQEQSPISTLPLPIPSITTATASAETPNETNNTLSST
jgi:hypothetical protein